MTFITHIHTHIEFSHAFQNNPRIQCLNSIKYSCVFNKKF